MPKLLILRNSQSPGDVVMLTAAVRDLHRSHPGRFVTDVRTPCPALWENNPYITAIREDEPGVRNIDCEYPLVHTSNQLPYHFIHGFRKHLESQLGIRIPPTDCRGDIHLSDAERAWMSQVEEHRGIGARFWIVVAGGKYDFTAKWWATDRYQAVIDHFRGRLLFVQVGEQQHHHPRLHHTLDLRGRTTLRQLIRLVHHADGVLCPVTLVMHLAAAVETRAGRPARRPCVVVAGGREPVHWEAYSWHQFVHTVGALPCCAAGGCWRSRVQPLGDGDAKDGPDQLCVDVRRGLPACMDLITPEDVIRRIEVYLDSSGVVRGRDVRERGEHATIP